MEVDALSKTNHISRFLMQDWGREQVSMQFSGGLGGFHLIWPKQAWRQGVSFWMQVDDFLKANRTSGILMRNWSKCQRNFETGRGSSVQFDRNRPEDRAAPFWYKWTALQNLTTCLESTRNIVQENKFPCDFETGRESFIQFDRSGPKARRLLFDAEGWLLKELATSQESSRKIMRESMFPWQFWGRGRGSLNLAETGLKTRLVAPLWFKWTTFRKLTTYLESSPKLCQRASFHAILRQAERVSFNLTETGLKTRRLLFDADGWLF